MVEVAEILLDVADVLKPYKLKQEDAQKVISGFMRITEIVKGLEETLSERE